MRIAIADDEPFIRTSLSQIVHSLDKSYEIIGSAKDGEEALHLINEYRPDVLITDIKMPGTDGLKLASAVGKCSPRTKVIILSGYAEFEYARSAIESHVYAYLLKPTKVDELQKTLRAIYAETDCAKQNESGQADPGTEVRFPGDGKAIIALILNIVENNYDQDISQTQIAEQVNLNPSYLSTLFHAETGKNFPRILQKSECAMPRNYW